MELVQRKQSTKAHNHLTACKVSTVGHQKREE